MKTSKPSATASDAPNRRQPVRQTRTNPPRSSATTGRGAGRDRDGVSGTAAEQPIDIFPGVTHFADAITALPKELVKHFTLLKEVDAKIHVPQQTLFQLINMALRQPVPNTTRSPYDGSTTAASSSSAQNNSAGSSASANGHPSQPRATGTEVATSDASDVPRRQLFRQVGLVIRDMLVALEEKNHVITTANDALNKQMGRIDDVWPHLELEFSDEAKWGSDSHWAYPENRAARASNNAQQAERSRREGAASLSAAAQQIAEEAAARSDARKQAVAARRSQKAAQQANHDSDADDLHHKAETKRAGGGTKSRKPAGAAADAAAAAAGVGLGILSGAAGAAPAAATAPKRRKVEKPAPTSAPMERALSGVYASATGSAKGRIASPRQSPAPEGGKKRKALPSGGNATKKSRNTASATSSPVIGAFPDPVKNARASPAPSNLGINTSESLSRSASQSGAYNGVSIPNTPSLIPTTELPTKKTADAGKDAAGARKPGSDDKAIAPPPFGGSVPASSSFAAGVNALSAPAAPAAPAAAANTSSPAVVNPSSSSHTNGITSNTPPVTTAIPPPTAPGFLNKESSRPPSTAASSGLPAPPVQAVSPTVEDQSEAQLKAENSKQRPPPLAPSAEIKTTSTAGAAPSPAAAAATQANPRAPLDKPHKVSPVPTPVPTPVPAPSHAPASVASPAKVQVLKVEATEASSTVSAVPMTRTRSAGGAKKETGSAQAPTSSAASATPATPTTSSGAFSSKPSVEASTPAVRPSSAASTSGAGTKKESTPLSSASVLSAQPSSVTTKSGRASKPSTPSLATFAESSTRSRPSRSSEPASGNNSSSAGNGSGNGSGSGSGSGNGASSTAKRSHKKGASSISSNAHAREGGHHRDHHRSHSSVAAGDGSSSAGPSHGAGNGSGNGTGSGSDVSSGSSRSQQQRQQQQKQKQSQQKQQQQVDENDPLYCYCQQVSFGEMIACDADDCEREWFHLGCAGLRVAPKSNVKWYCEDCKRRLRVKSGGR